MNNKMDGTNAYKVIDADYNIVLQVFHEDQREEVMEYYKNLGKYGSVSEDCDKDIICWEMSEAIW